MSIIDWSKPLQMKHGRPVTYVGTLPDGKIVLGAESKGKWYGTTRWPDGKLNEVGDSDFDIENVPPKPIKHYVNIYRYGRVAQFWAGEVTKEPKTPDSTEKFVKTIEFEV